MENPEKKVQGKKSKGFLFGGHRDQKKRRFLGKITGLELRSQLLHDSITLFLWHILGAPDDTFRNWMKLNEIGLVVEP